MKYGNAVLDLEVAHAEALVLNYLYDWAISRAAQRGHPYYIAFAHDMQALVRSYNDLPVVR